MPAGTPGSIAVINNVPSQDDQRSYLGGCCEKFSGGVFCGGPEIILSRNYISISENNTHSPNPLAARQAEVGTLFAAIRDVHKRRLLTETSSVPMPTFVHVTGAATSVC
jgi:hypothetical protein